MTNEEQGDIIEKLKYIFYLLIGLGESFLKEVFSFLIEKYIFQFNIARTEKGRIPRILKFFS